MGVAVAANLADWVIGFGHYTGVCEGAIGRPNRKSRSIGCITGKVEGWAATWPVRPRLSPTAHRQGHQIDRHHVLLVVG
jgi:hypothetical protein